MTQPTADKKPSPPATDDKHWAQQFWVTVAMLVVLGALGTGLLITANVSDNVWQHRAYVYGTLEAIVFTAVGWLFGREVHRGEAVTAKTDAAASKQDAQQATSALTAKTADVARVQAKLTALASAVTNASAGPADQDRSRGIPGDNDNPPGPTAGPLTMLRALAADLVKDET